MLMDCTTCHGFDEFDDMGLQRADAPLHLYPIKTNDLCNFVDARDVPPWLCLATTDARCLGRRAASETSQTCRQFEERLDDGITTATGNMS